MGTAARVRISGAATLVVAAVCWLVALTHMNSLPLVELAPVMMAAMMLPTAVPFVAGQAEQARAAVLALPVYVMIWSVIGIFAFMLTAALPMASLPVAVGAVCLAILYGLTPVHHAFRNRCRQVCREPGPAVRLGLRYSINCVGCSAGVMVALFAVGPMNPLWMLGATAAVCAYKLTGKKTEASASRIPGQ